MVIDPIDMWEKNSINLSYLASQNNILVGVCFAWLDILVFTMQTLS